MWFVIFAVGIAVMAHAFCGNAATDCAVRYEQSAQRQVERACERLGEYMDVPAKPEVGAERVIMVQRFAKEARELGTEGYRITTENPSLITVRANTDGGLANGVYTLLRTLMIEDRRDPFEGNWQVEETPFFRIRSMMVAPYNFGFAHGFSILSPDRWAFKHWKQYLDFLRLCNLNRVGIYPMRAYDPQIPETIDNKWRYEVWREAMEYAHELGMEFTFVLTANFVPQELWWRYPELRCEHDTVWAGAALCYSKARDIIRETQRYTFEFFKGADHFMLMFSDGGGGCYCDRCSADQTAVFLRMVADVRKTLSEVGSNADVIFWNWALDFWYHSIPAGIPEYLEQFPRVRDIQEEVFKRLPRDVPFEDVSVVPRLLFPGKTDTLKRAKEEGFETVINFVYPMGPELPQFIFPQGRIRVMMDIARYSKRTGIDGMDGYRLSPATRVLNDFVFMRLAWNPDLNFEQLVDELAGYLTEKRLNRAKIADAIRALEFFWEGVDAEANVTKAAALMDEVKAQEDSIQLQYVADMVSLLPGIYRLSQKETTREQADAIKKQMFAETHKRYILQGFGGTDIQWVPAAEAYFNAYVGMWMPVHLLPIPLTEEVNE